MTSKKDKINLTQGKKFAAAALIIFYAVGFTGIIVHATNSFFLRLFPLAILLSFALLLAFNSQPYNLRMVIMIISTAIAGFFVEVAGVSTGSIFGRYIYGETLGPKILDTPVMIGINWAMLVFATASMTGGLPVSESVKIISASLIMVLYDILMEISAPSLGMWTWEEEHVPVRNYIAWFLISLVLHSVYRFTRVRPGSTLAPAVIACQASFFILLLFYYKIL